MSKKDHILQTAIRLFVNQGFENTPTKQISKEAGVATGTLFHHFETKEDLINQAYIYVKEIGIKDTVSINSSHLSVKDRLKKIWYSSIEWGFHHPMEVKFGFMFSNSVYITKLTKEDAENTMEPFTTVLVEGIKEGIFKDLPQKVLENIYYCIYQSFVHYIWTSEKLDENMISKGFEVLWDALKN